MRIYIANLAGHITNDSLKNKFASYGDVQSAEIMNDVFTGESRGFGYVEMESDEAAEKAITSLNNTEWETLTIAVQPAPPVKVHQGSYKIGNGPVNAYKFRKN